MVNLAPFHCLLITKGDSRKTEFPFLGFITLLWTESTELYRLLSNWNTYQNTWRASWGAGLWVPRRVSNTEDVEWGWSPGISNKFPGDGPQPYFEPHWRDGLSDFFQLLVTYRKVSNLASFISPALVGDQKHHYSPTALAKVSGSPGKLSTWMEENTVENHFFMYSFTHLFNRYLWSSTPCARHCASCWRDSMTKTYPGPRLWCVERLWRKQAVNLLLLLKNRLWRNRLFFVIIEKELHGPIRIKYSALEFVIITKLYLKRLIFCRCLES